MRMEARIPKLKFVFFGCGGWGWTDRQRGESNFTCQQIIYGLSVQCNVVEPYSIVQFSPALGWFTKKYRKCMQNTKKHAKALTFLVSSRDTKTSQKSRLSFKVWFWPIRGNCSVLHNQWNWIFWTIVSSLHWPKLVLGPSTRSFFDLQKLEFCSGENIQTYRHTKCQTTQIVDWIGPEGQFCKNSHT